ncbi:MAG: ANTAR domain-containing protein [Nocardioidaceae bacterium]|nr:ANTAR domain-containing protein [Nocardioidaceae bacterium]
MGAIDLYRDTPGVLHDVDLALTYAEAALQLVIDWRDGSTGMTAQGQQWRDAQPQVHQAAGMVMVQLDTDISSAFAALRAYAYRSDRRLADVAKDVVSGTLRLQRNWRLVSWVWTRFPANDLWPRLLSSWPTRLSRTSMSSTSFTCWPNAASACSMWRRPG